SRRTRWLQRAPCGAPGTTTGRVASASPPTSSPSSPGRAAACTRAARTSPSGSRNWRAAPPPPARSPSRPGPASSSWPRPCAPPSRCPAPVGARRSRRSPRSSTGSSRASSCIWVSPPELPSCPMGRARLRGVTLTLLVALLTTIGHAGAGGSLPDLSLLVVLLPLLGGAFVALAERTRGFAGTVAVLGGGQLVLHATLSARSEE